MDQVELQTECLNPCPTCGKKFDFNGCMTFVADSLQTWTGGKCPVCGTQVVVQTQRYIYSREWAQERELVRLRQFRIDELGLSVRTTHSLEQMGAHIVGQLLEMTENDIRSTFPACESVIREINKLLGSKELRLRA